MNKKDEYKELLISIIGIEIVTKLEEVLLPAGYIIESSKQKKDYYFLLTGFVALVHNTHVKELTFPYPYKGGEVIGSMHVNNPYAYSWEFQCITEVEAIKIPEKLYNELLDTNIKFTKYLFDDASDKMASAFTYSYIRSKKGLRGAYAYVLVNHSENGILNIRSISKLANMLDVSRVAFYSVHNEFEKLKYIEKIDRTKIKVLRKLDLMDIYEENLLDS